MKPSSALVVMAKQPQAGKTKTRLCPPFTQDQAARFYEALLKDTLALAGGLDGIQLAIAVTPPNALEYFREISPAETLLLPISEPHLGLCLEHALESLLELGFIKVMALNADGPSLPQVYIQQAVHLLEDHDLVLGPGEDGGYYLIGMTSLWGRLFQGIHWSSSSVLEETLEISRELGLKTALTPSWYDVDTPRDALRLKRELDNLPEERLVYCRIFFTKEVIPDLGESSRVW